MPSQPTPSPSECSLLHPSVLQWLRAHKNVRRMFPLLIKTSKKEHQPIDAIAIWGCCFCSSAWSNNCSAVLLCAVGHRAAFADARGAMLLASALSSVVVAVLAVDCLKTQSKNITYKKGDKHLVWALVSHCGWTHRPGNALSAPGRQRQREPQLQSSPWTPRSNRAAVEIKSFRTPATIDSRAKFPRKHACAGCGIFKKQSDRSAVMCHTNLEKGDAVQCRLAEFWAGHACGKKWSWLRGSTNAPLRFLFF